MKKFYNKVCLFVVLQGIILLFVLLFNRPRESSYLHGYRLKNELLEKTKGQRIILIGGSNLAFGLDSERLDQDTNRTPLNLGLHAGLGRHLILNQAVIDHAKPGDLVVLSLEYGQYRKISPDEIVWQLIRLNPNTVFDLGRADFVNLTESGLSYIGDQIRHSAKNLSNGRTSLPNSPVYHVDGFNSYGDITSHWPLGHRDGPRKIADINTESRHFKKALQQISKFSDAVERSGAAVIYCAPPIHKSQYPRNAVELKNLERKIEDHCGIPVVLRAEEMIFAEQHYFDTAYHLNYTGVIERTNRLSAAIRDFEAKAGAKGAADL